MADLPGKAILVVGIVVTVSSLFFRHLIVFTIVGVIMILYSLIRISQEKKQATVRGSMIQHHPAQAHMQRHHHHIQNHPAINPVYQQPHQNFCPRCMNPVHPHAKFCSMCGQMLR